MNEKQKIFSALCERYGLPCPIPEYRFCFGRRWRIDYYFEADNGRRVGLEVEGGVWSAGRHVRPKGFLADIEKYNQMAMQGIFLLRTTPDKLLSAETIENLKQVIYGS